MQEIFAKIEILVRSNLVSFHIASPMQSAARCQGFMSRGCLVVE